MTALILMLALVQPEAQAAPPRWALSDPERWIAAECPAADTDCRRSAANRLALARVAAMETAATAPVEPPRAEPQRPRVQSCVGRMDGNEDPDDDSVTARAGLICSWSDSPEQAERARETLQGLLDW